MIPATGHQTMAFQAGETGGAELIRRLGGNELFCHFCHNAGNLNVMVGLTLLTRTAIDEGKATDIDIVCIHFAAVEKRLS